MTSTTHTSTQDRIWTPGRLATLIAVAIVFGGLAWAALKHPPGWAKVPDGARAGQLEMKPCTYPTEAGDIAADCGTLVVRENRADPTSRLIALPVTRIRSRSPRPAAPIFRLEGGPGATNMHFAYASRYNARRDVVLVGYRGVDGSARLDCPEVTHARRHTADLLSASAIRASERAVRACADRLREDGFDLAGYTLAERVDDLEAARRALGYERVDLLSESFGTRVALVYAWRHRTSVRRSVMVGANPPGNFVWKPEQSDAQLRRYAELCGRACATGAGDLDATMRATVASMPKRWGPFPIAPGTVKASSFFGLMEASAEAAPVSAPMTLDAWHEAAEGDASGLWLQSILGALVFPRAEVWGDTAAMARVDAAVARRHFARAPRGILGDAGSRFLWGDGALARAWPASADESAYSRMRDSDVPTLVISGELDGATPAANATRELMPHLPNGRQVVLEGVGHTIDFFDRQVAAGNRLVNGYLDSGRVDASLYVPQKVDFTPAVRQTNLAKGLVGTMLVLALVTLLTLAAMVRRVHRRGRLGRVTRVAAATAGALVLGLGGWFAVVLVALVALPSVPIDATVLIVGGMALPAAITSWCGWRAPDRCAGAAAGFVAAVAGALAGGWLGLHSADAMLAIVTTLAGAVAGANLALVACDITAQVLRPRGASPSAAQQVRVAVYA